MRSEQEIFDELAGLCATPGYAHAIAYFCYRDQFIGISDELKPEDYSKLFSAERLIRTEISTLIGLMLRAPRDLTLPEPKTFEAYIVRTEALLEELHHALRQPMLAELQTEPTDPATTENVDLFANAAVMREPIFYGGELSLRISVHRLRGSTICSRCRLVTDEQGILAGGRQKGRCGHQFSSERQDFSDAERNEGAAVRATDYPRRISIHRGRCLG